VSDSRKTEGLCYVKTGKIPLYCNTKAVFNATAVAGRWKC